MNTKALKKYLGLVWLVAGPVLFAVLIGAARHYINAKAGGDAGKPVPWIIIIIIFTPIAVGLSIFGWYCLRDEYADDDLVDHS
ncbi:MAG: hypothetical protein JWP27_714 [Flaviaesturariibacter sp.]|nr:hypothetical protein [Flaviaesturariibacter sp.]